MEQVDENVCHLEGEGCVLTFVEAPVFALTAATAFAAGEMGKPCGDASSFLESERGTALLAVSDGMGTGEKAAAESKAAIELLEQFAVAGFSRELAVQLINSALLLRRAEENLCNAGYLQCGPLRRTGGVHQAGSGGFFYLPGQSGHFRLCPYFACGDTGTGACGEKRHCV